MADVFISYARSAEPTARALSNMLERQGYSVWYDARLPAHRSYSDVIRQQLDAAKAVLVLWCPDAVRSHWVRSEADRAMLNGSLIQARIEDCVLPMPFDQIQCPSLADWDGDPRAPSLSAVLGSLAELLSASGSPDCPFVARIHGQPRAKIPRGGHLLRRSCSKLR